METWTRENLAWLAGILEGEGTFRLHQERQPCVTVAMTDEDVIRRAHEVAGVGNVRGPYTPKGKKPFWVWTVAKSCDAYALSVAVYPWLCSRRRAKIREIIRGWTAWEQTNPMPGRNRGSAKITADLVLSLRARVREEGRLPYGEVTRIAAEAGVERSAIHRAIRGATWSHLP